MAKDISNIISYDRNGFIINGKREYLIGGEFHYFRVPAAMWEDRLQKMKATGANLISVYIAWNMHEPEEGKQIWDGDYDLDRFLRLCEKYGFYVLIKPGPYICAELDFGGHPDWLIKKIANKEFRLRMLDEKYIELCKYWYKSCAKQINSHLITNGGTIIAAQLENEYDHLIEYGEEVITVDDAIEYFMILKGAMEEYGIDVPKFANEAEFLRGRDIIDTRTYYPNIPGLWMSEYERFEEKLLSSKTAQDGPVMILELQAGWFSQIGAPTYIPGVDVVEGVSKSVFITGASVVNYYMMVGGTTFPYMGGRGDTALGGYGNITSYDFGGAPVGETGEVNQDKFYYIKGFIRFASEFSHIIAESDGRHLVKISSGGEDVAILNEDSAFLDVSINKSYENFTTYEEGNENGRFFFVRNVEKEDKEITIHIPDELMGREYNFKTTVKADQTRMYPVNFKVADTDLRINYSTSEVWMTRKYPQTTALIMHGAAGIAGELCLNAKAADVKILEGAVTVFDADKNTILCYENHEPAVAEVNGVTIFLMPETMVGRIDDLENGLLMQDAYYLEDTKMDEDGMALTLQIKEDTKTEVSFYPMTDKSPKKAVLNGTKIPLRKTKAGFLKAAFETAGYADRPEITWTSDWKYKADSKEISPKFDDSSWTQIEKPISLEEIDLFEHGYYWYRASFEVDDEVLHANMSFAHNDTDRYLLYLNGKLVFRSRNKSMDHHNITDALVKGKNTIAVLYANEFHNKSHPHEGAIVKFSGIMNPFIIEGQYQDGQKINIKVEKMTVKYQLNGSDLGYDQLAFDDSKWQSAPDVKKLVVGREMGHVVWFRRHFTYDPAIGYLAPLQIVPLKADERLLIYVNGKPVAQYDIIGPQEEFYIPDSYLNYGGDNVISIVLECPGFFEEIMSGYRRGFLYNPLVQPAYVAKRMKLQLLDGEKGNKN